MDGDIDLDALLDEAACGFYRTDGQRARDAPATAVTPGAQEVQEEKGQLPPPPRRKFDPLAKKAKEKPRLTTEKDVLSERMKTLRTNDDSRDGNKDFEKTLRALGVPTSPGSFPEDDEDHRATSSEGGPSSDADSSSDAESNALVDMIMRQLLSKDVLYEPMKEIGAKYPAYLSENRETLDSAEIARYERQEVYIRKICAVYEAPDCEARYEELMELLQGMQQCGSPPGEIMKALHPEDGVMDVGGLFGDESGGCPVS